MNEEGLHERIARLEARMDVLVEQQRSQQETREQEFARMQHRESEEDKAKEAKREAFSRRLASIGTAALLAALFLIAMAIVLRYRLEALRYAQAVKAVAGVEGARAPAAAPLASPGSPPSPLSPNVSVPAPVEAPGAKQALDNYVDHAARKSSGGNSYSITLSGIKEVVDALKKTTQLTAEKAASLMEELGKSAISATGEIIKETAKAIIARELGPEPESEAKPKVTAGGPTQQVLVNVYGSDKQVTVSRPTSAPPRPAKPKPAPKPKPKAKPSCPAPSPVAEPASCPTVQPHALDLSK